VVHNEFHLALPSNTFSFMIWKGTRLKCALNRKSGPDSDPAPLDFSNYTAVQLTRGQNQRPQGPKLDGLPGPYIGPQTPRLHTARRDEDGFRLG
jgi:hypothetical protein